MQWLWIGLSIVAGVIVIIVLWGAMLPKEHSCTVKRNYHATPQQLWALITGVEDFPRWRKDIKSIEVRERDKDGAPSAWTEHGSLGPIPLRNISIEPPVCLVGRIDSDKLPFGGTWTYRIEDLGNDQASLSITEDGIVGNVIFRFLSRYAFGHDKTMKAYHSFLAAELEG